MSRNTNQYITITPEMLENSSNGNIVKRKEEAKQWKRSSPWLLSGMKKNDNNDNYDYEAVVINNLLNDLCRSGAKILGKDIDVENVKSVRAIKDKEKRKVALKKLLKSYKLKDKEINFLINGHSQVASSIVNGLMNASNGVQSFSFVTDKHILSINRDEEGNLVADTTIYLSYIETSEMKRSTINLPPAFMRSIFTKDTVKEHGTKLGYVKLPYVLAPFPFVDAKDKKISFSDWYQLMENKPITFAKFEEINGQEKTYETSQKAVIEDMIKRSKEQQSAWQADLSQEQLKKIDKQLIRRKKNLEYLNQEFLKDPRIALIFSKKTYLSDKTLNKIKNINSKNAILNTIKLRLTEYTSEVFTLSNEQRQLRIANLLKQVKFLPKKIKKEKEKDLTTLYKKLISEFNYLREVKHLMVEKDLKNMDYREAPDLDGAKTLITDTEKTLRSVEKFLITYLKKAHYSRLAKHFKGDDWNNEDRSLIKMLPKEIGHEKVHSVIRMKLIISRFREHYNIKYSKNNQDIDYNSLNKSNLHEIREDCEGVISALQSVVDHNDKNKHWWQGNRFAEGFTNKTDDGSKIKVKGLRALLGKKPDISDVTFSEELGEKIKKDEDILFVRHKNARIFSSKKHSVFEATVKSNGKPQQAYWKKIMIFIKDKKIILEEIKSHDEVIDFLKDIKKDIKKVSRPKGLAFKDYRKIQKIAVSVLDSVVKDRLEIFRQQEKKDKIKSSEKYISLSKGLEKLVSDYRTILSKTDINENELLKSIKSYFKKQVINLYAQQVNCYPDHDFYIDNTVAYTSPIPGQYNETLKVVADELLDEIKESFEKIVESKSSKNNSIVNETHFSANDKVKGELYNSDNSKNNNNFSQNGSLNKRDNTKVSNHKQHSLLMQGQNKQHDSSESVNNTIPKKDNINNLEFETEVVDMNSRKITNN